MMHPIGTSPSQSLPNPLSFPGRPPELLIDSLTLTHQLMTIGLTYLILSSTGHPPARLPARTHPPSPPSNPQEATRAALINTICNNNLINASMKPSASIHPPIHPSTRHTTVPPTSLAPIPLLTTKVLPTYTTTYLHYYYYHYYYYYRDHHDYLYLTTTYYHYYHSYPPATASASAAASTAAAAAALAPLPGSQPDVSPPCCPRVVYSHPGPLLLLIHNLAL